MAVHKPEDVKDMTDAPLGVESVWKAKNGKYVNVALLLKTGKMDDSSQGQAIALVCDSFSDTEDGRKVAELRFVHDQGGVPQYYTSRVYVSIPMAEFSDVDKIDITFNTYNGTVRKSLPIK